MTTPRYKHDCDRCVYLGSGECNALGEGFFDFYTCTNPDNVRSFIARYGNEGSEYASTRLFSCVELTRLDKIALYSGLELTAEEEKGLLRCLATMWKETQTRPDYRDTSIKGADFFGKGNVCFEDTL